jgi:hypothetical protein
MKEYIAIEKTHKADWAKRNAKKDKQVVRA